MGTDRSNRRSCRILAYRKEIKPLSRFGTYFKRLADNASRLARGALVEIGLLEYKPGPWSKSVWNTAYDNGQLDYFSDLSERGRYSVLIGYLHYLQENDWSNPESPHSGDILDVGCGSGLLYERSRNIEFSTWTGVDLSEVAIEKANQISKSHKDSRAHFICEDMLSTDTRWEKNSYDTIVVNEVLNMCADPNQMLERLSQSLRPNGTIIISAWRHLGDRRLWIYIRNHLTIIERIDLKSSISSLAPRGWRVSLLKIRRC